MSVEVRTLGGDPAGHILHGAANRVAAVEGSLRTPQDFDPLDVVNVEHRGLRAVEVDIVEIDTDALLKPGNRVLLADAANECGQGGVGAARCFERYVGGGVADVSNVQRALAL